jgi:tetratricopeptide (TPR) repeat protein
MLRRAIVLGIPLAVCCLSAFASPDQWVEVRSEHFTVLTDSDEKQARHLLDQFERMRWMFQTLFTAVTVDPPAPIVVVAAKSQKIFDTLEPAAYLAKGQMKIGGYFMQAADKNYILLRLDAEFEHPYASVYHEYTHLHFSNDAEWLPLWLNEGLAEFFQNTEIRDKQVVIGEASPDDILFLRQNSLIALPVLFRVDAKSPYYHEEQKGSVFYAESWALTHMLMLNDRKMLTNHVSEYMIMLSRHEDPVGAAEKAFGDLGKLQKALSEYIGRRMYSDLILNSAAAPVDESGYKFRTLTPVEYDAVHADVLAYVQRVDDSRALLDEILKADPNNAQAHETLGFLAFGEGHLDEAEKDYAEAVKLDSQSYLAHYYFAAFAMQRAGSADDEAIEASLRTAIKLNPRFAPAYERLASFYGMRREHLDEAKDLIVQAIKLDPGSLNIRINAANIFISLNQYDNAVVVLRSAAKVARNPSEVQMVQDRLAQLDQMRAVSSQASASSHVTGLPGRTIVVPTDTGPKHPTEPADGPKHEAIGVIRKVKCSYPSVIEFSVEGAGKTISLYSNNYFKMDFTAVGFTPEGEMHPCEDIEGMKARVQYAESSDKTVDGQAISIELRK